MSHSTHAPFRNSMLARLRIGTALSFGFTLVLGLTLGVAAVSWYGLRAVEGGVRELSDRALPNERALARADRALADAQRSVNALFIPRLSHELWKAAWARLDECVVSFHEARKDWEAIPSLPETVAIWNQTMAGEERWEQELQLLNGMLKQRDALLRSGHAYESGEVQALEAEAWPHYDKLRELIKTVDQDLVKVRAAMASEAGTQSQLAHRASRGAESFLALAVLIVAALLAGLATTLTRHINRTVSGLRAEANKLSSAVREGKLEVRGDLHAVHFQFEAVVEGMNQTMDAFLQPVQMASKNLERISQGDIPELVADQYAGDFDLIKRSVNRCIGAVGALVEDAKALSRAAVEGKLSTRADVSKHRGDFRKIVDGVNRTLDAVIEPVSEAALVLSKLSQRDLRARMEGNYQGDHARIKESVNATAATLHDAVAQVADAVDQVSGASEQIASSSQAVAAGASEQASSIEETSASLESMSSSTQVSAENAQQASALAQVAKGAAGAGMTAMTQMQSAMEKIRTSAEGTSQIIKEINEIAFQTNLLALNAAVEAARAGEAGRGFAVVAEEVRSLALRSKEAANKTEELIRQSVKEAAEGALTSKKVNEKLAEITGSIGKVTDIVAEIASVAKEQADGIGQVTKAVSEMDKVTQQNAASSEEASSSAEELSSQSHDLATLVQSFRIDRITSEGAAPTRHGVARAVGAKALPRAAGKKMRPVGTNRKGGAPMGLEPEDVIPLDDDTVFKEF